MPVLVPQSVKSGGSCQVDLWSQHLVSLFFFPSGFSPPNQGLLESKHGKEI